MKSIEKIKKTNNGYLVNGDIDIPNDKNNRDYQAIQKWIDEGGKVEPEFSDLEILEKLKESKKQEIKIAFLEESNKPIDYKNIMFNGGKESGASALYVKSMLEATNSIKGSFYNIENIEVELTLQEIIELALTIGVKYQQDFKKHQALKIEILSIKTIEELKKIKW